MQSPATITVQGNGSHNNAAVNQPTDVTVRLPKVDVPIFPGNIFEWESFRDQFKSMVHDSPSLSAVQKLVYLQRQLEEDTAELLRNTPISAANYASA